MTPLGSTSKGRAAKRTVVSVVIAVSTVIVIIDPAVAAGSGVLVVIGGVIGIGVLFFFDAAFLLFHRVFFAQGNFTFDPRTQRLVQLLPDQFWTESVTAVALVGFAIAVLVTLLTYQRGASLARR